MQYLKFPELNARLIIMIDFENGESKPYFLYTIGTALHSKKWMMHGILMEIIIKNPKSHPHPEKMFYSYYLPSQHDPENKDKEVKGFRELTQEEQDKLSEELRSVGKGYLVDYFYHPSRVKN